MLKIHPSKSTEAALQYFRESITTSDYYNEKKEITGTWHGKLAEQLGLEGEVNEKDFRRLLHNKKPNGEKLTPRNYANRRAMYDFTFSAPKACSILYSIAQDDDVLRAHQTAVEKVMQEIEDNMLVQRGFDKDKHWERIGNMLYAEFVHDSARPIKQSIDGEEMLIPDCQLHSHCTVMNACWDEKNNDYRAIEIHELKRLAPYYEALYHSYLGFELQAAGYEIEKEGKRFEVKGITKEIRDKFSGRTLQIEEEFKKRGLKSVLQKAALGKLTRAEKSESAIAKKDLHELWKDRLSLSEYHAIMNAKGSASKGGKSEGNKAPTMNAEKAIDMAFSHHFERRSEIEEKLLLAYAVDLTSGHISPQELKAELAGRENIISTEIRTETHITTKQMLAEEKAMIDFASGGKNMCPPLNPDYEIQSDMLNDGQRAAIEHALNSTDKMMLISGSAGVGKTTLLQTVRDGIEEAGKTLFAFAPTAAASRGQLQDKGFEGADTIARLIRDEELQASLQDQVIMIDEAGMVGIPTMRSIQEIADANNARILLSGDAKQHAAVERGDAQRILQQHSKLPVAGVTKVVRQDNVEYKQAVEMLSSSLENQDDPIARKEDVAKAFDRLDEQGSIIEVEDRDERHKALAEDYLKSSEKSAKDVLLVSPTHAEGKEITEVIREKLKETGRLEQEDSYFDRLQSRNFTDIEKQIPENFSKGDFIEFHKNAKDGFRPGFKFEITGKDDDGNVLVQHDGIEAPVPLPLELHDRFQVFEKETIGLATGDQLRITKNLKSEENRKLFNGQKYSVTGFTKEGDIKLSNQQVLSKDARHFDLGYYSTSHAAQGKDAKTVIVAQSSVSVGASNEKQFYVSVSRGKSDCRVYTDDKEYLREMITKSGDRLSATEIAEKAREEQREWYKQAEHVNKVKEHYELDLEPPPIKHTPHYEPKRNIGKGFEP